MSLLQSNSRDAELLALADFFEKKAGGPSIVVETAFDTVTIHVLPSRLLEAARALRSALPSPADNPSREGLAVACLRRLARANIDNITQRALAGSDIVSMLVKIDSLAANPPDPDSMSDKRAKEDMKLAHNVRQATIRECAEIAKAVYDFHDKKATELFKKPGEWIHREARDAADLILQNIRKLSPTPTQDKPK